MDIIYVRCPSCQKRRVPVSEHILTDAEDVIVICEWCKKQCAVTLNIKKVEG